MTRRRLVLAALAVAALGAALWLLDDRLSTQEQAVVGTWRTPADRRGGYKVYTLRADRRWLLYVQLGDGGGGMGYEGSRWYVRDGELVTDHAPDLLHRLVRWPAGLVGRRLAPEYAHRVESVSPTELEVTYPTGDRLTWTRFPVGE